MIRQFPTNLGGGPGSALAPYVSLDPSNFSLDSTDVGSDFGTSFGLMSSVDFNPDTQGTAWAHFNFKESGFDYTKDILFDLHWVANGSIGSTLAARINTRLWAVDTETEPLLASPTDTSTTDISITAIHTDIKMLTSGIITLSAVDLSATIESILVSITRAAAHGNDTYTGTFQVVNIVARQVIA
jgi:hypothetical protein